jgi:acetyltransferase-like isoleucine patch superfamily enzyme
MISRSTPAWAITRREEKVVCMHGVRTMSQWLSTRECPGRDIALGAEGVLRYLLLRLRFRNLPAEPFFVHRRADIIVGREAEVCFGHMVRFMQDFTGHFYGQVRIGNNVYFNRGCYLSVYNRLSIGDDCLFGEYVSIHDENHVPGRDATPIARRGYASGTIEIGNNVWVGAKATIVQGVRIGDGAVIGANAVVTRDIPAHSVAVGIPARVTREL